MQNTDKTTDAQALPQTLTAEQAIARLSTWIEDPGEDFAGRIIEAACVLADGKPGGAELLVDAVKAYRAEQVERVQTSTGSFGCAWDAYDIRRELRESSMIVEVEGHTMGGVMLRARGCYIAYRDGEGQWRGVGSSKREDPS